MVPDAGEPGAELEAAIGHDDPVGMLRALLRLAPPDAAGSTGTHADVLLSLAHWLREEGRVEDADRVLRMALGCTRSVPKGKERIEQLSGVTATLIRWGRTAEAEPLLAQVLDLDTELRSAASVREEPCRADRAWEEEPDPERRAELMHQHMEQRIAHARRRGYRPGTGLARPATALAETGDYDRVLLLADRIEEPALREQVLTEVAGCMIGGDRMREAQALLPSLGVDAREAAWERPITRLLRHGRIEAAQELCARIGEAHVRARWLGRILEHLVESGRPGDAAQHLPALLAAALECEDPGWRAVRLDEVVRISLSTGRLDTAVEAAQEMADPEARILALGRIAGRLALRR